MRAKAEQAAGEARLDPAELRYARRISVRAHALAMLRQVRLGRPPLGEHGSVVELDDWLTSEPHPQRGTPEELALADRLVQLAGGTDLLAPSRMADLLTTHGLTGLAAAQDSHPTRQLPAGTDPAGTAASTPASSVWQTRPDGGRQPTDGIVVPLHRTSLRRPGRR
jgi:hypothetical protein